MNPWVSIIRTCAAVALLTLLATAPEAAAKLQVSLEVNKVSEHSQLVTIEWRASVTADREWDKCRLVISFRDARDREINRIEETVSVGKGVNEIVGHEICPSAVWDKTRKFSGNLDCGF